MQVEKKRILIVDDDVNLISVMKIYFQRSGMVAKVLDSGKKALRTMDDFNPDLVILDIRMPKMDGVSLCKNIRMSKRSRVPIIALTGYHSEKGKREVLAAGANLYLTKPVDMATLLKHVKKLTSKREEQG